MEILTKASRISFGLMIGALAIQQILFAEFRPVIFPPWHTTAPWYAICVYIISVTLIAAGLAIIFDKNARIVSLVMGGILLAVCLCNVPYILLNNPYYGHLAVWADAQKEVAFAGGAFAVAGSYKIRPAYEPKHAGIINFLEKMMPFGSILFCSTMISFGLDHLLYGKYIAVLVPRWIHGYLFWTYFAGVALIASGVCITFRVKPKLNALLLALMLFLWLIILHIPRAIADPFSLQGNEISSVFEALGFSGIAYLIAYSSNPVKAG